MATLAAALAAGIPIADAIYLANKAAGIVVGKIGTSPILFKELQDELQIGKPASKLIPIPQLADTIKQLRAQERKIHIHKRLLRHSDTKDTCAIWKRPKDWGTYLS